MSLWIEYVVMLIEGVWKAILSVYIQDDSLPLPTFEEVLICTENTTLEEVCADNVKIDAVQVNCCWHAIMETNVCHMFT